MPDVFSQDDPQSDTTSLTPPSRRERLRLADSRFVRTPDGRCTAEVVLDWVDGNQFRGSSSGLSSPAVDLRVAAEAAIRALHTFAKGELAFELLGVKSIRAFDANVIIVSVAVKHGPGPQRLVGVCLVENDPVHGAVLAVLNATNRVLGNYIATK